MGTIETAKEAERSVVDIETLQHTNQQLISTLDEVLNIQREGAAEAQGRRGGAGPHRGRAEAKAVGAEKLKGEQDPPLESPPVCGLVNAPGALGSR